MKAEMRNLVTVCAILCATNSVCAQAPTEAPQAVPSLTADANLVVVDVVITDHDNPVGNLQKEKFHLYDDGKEQKISGFDETHTASMVKAKAKNVALPPHVYRNNPDYEANAVVNVLLLDALNTPTQDQASLRKQMIDYLANVSQGTPMAVFTLASKLRLVQGFTTDGQALASAFKDPRSLQQGSALLDSSDTDSMNEMADSMDPRAAAVIASIRQFAADTESYKIDARVHMTIDAMKALVNYLSAIPGRKNLIWLSGAFPIAIAPDSTLPQAFSAMRNYNDEIQDLNLKMSTGRVAIYPVDARGLMTLPSYSASTRSSQIRKNGMGGNTMDTKFVERTNSEHETMAALAEATGGREFVNTNGLKEAVATITQIGANYYTLAFVPPSNHVDGKFHRIKIKIDGVDAKLAYRRGYFADRSQKVAQDDPRLKNGVAMATMFGGPISSQIEITARLLPASDPQVAGYKFPDEPAGAMATKLKQPLTRYVIDLALDAHQLGFEKSAEGKQQAQIQVILVAYDKDGKPVNMFDKAFGLNLTETQYQQILKDHLRGRYALDLPTGQLSLRIAVIDLSHAKTGSLEVPLKIAAAQ